MSDLYQETDANLIQKIKGIFPTHRHIKTDKLYEKLGDGIIEADLTPCIIYMDKDGFVWVRPKVEFEDGRFEHV